jgi:flagellum-specific ATP synthase
VSAATASGASAELARVVRAAAQPRRFGKVARIAGIHVEAHVEQARVGDLVEIDAAGGQVAGQVIGFHDQRALILPFSDVRGVAVGARVADRGSAAEVRVGDDWIGRVVDAFGRPLDGKRAPRGTRVPVDCEGPALARRRRIDQRLDTGVRVIDGLLTLGRGQRVGIFAGAGVGKTQLIRQIIDQSNADVTVVGLIGERGCEVHDLLVSGALPRSVVVAATSDRSPLERVRGAQVATAVAEYFRERGQHVLLVIDSLTRYAMALREIGLAAGELPATKGYPPSVFAAMPRLLERVAPLRDGGSVTGVYTVLVEGDELSDPVADSARSLLDGHIVLSRELAERGHFPAVDLLSSTSRVLQKVTTNEAQAVIERARRLMAARREAEELRSLGAYTPGVHRPYDEALALAAKFDAWARQRQSEKSEYAATLTALAQAIGEASGASRGASRGEESGASRGASREPVASGMPAKIGGSR